MTDLTGRLGPKFCRWCGKPSVYSVCSDECGEKLERHRLTMYLHDHNEQQQNAFRNVERISSDPNDNATNAEPLPDWAHTLLHYILGFVAGVFVALLLLRGIAGAEILGFRNPVAQTEAHSQCPNVLLGVQLADAITTRAILHGGGYERNPLAKPFVQSTLGAYSTVAAVNVIARLVTHHSPSLTCAAAGVESLAVANNLRVLGRMR